MIADFCRETHEGIEACCEIMNDQDDDSLYKIIEDYCQYRPAWCPLQTIPNEEEGSDCFDEFEDGYAQGWNSCIEEILG